MDRMTDDDRQESVVVMIVVDGTDVFEQVKEVLEVCSGETMAYCHSIMLVNTQFFFTSPKSIIYTFTFTACRITALLLLALILTIKNVISLTELGNSWFNN